MHPRYWVPLTMLCLLAATARADIYVPSVPVGNVGNPGELSGAGAGGHGTDRICGAVGYEYYIGRNEVTNAQFAAFLNAVATTSDTYGLWHANMGDVGEQGGIARTGSPGSYSYEPIAGRATMPVNWVTFWDACRFANWMHNGQPVGVQDATTTESGAYTLDGYTGNDGSWITRNADASVFIPSEDEWYKAAYHKNDGVTGNYWDYPTRSDALPSAEPPPGTNPTCGSANYDWAVGDFTAVGSYTFGHSDGPYSTMDQAGNAWEWNEEVLDTTWHYRGVRGGSLADDSGDDLAAATRDNGGIPSGENFDMGFRIAFIPEPATSVLLAVSALLHAGMRRRRETESGNHPR